MKQHKAWLGLAVTTLLILGAWGLFASIPRTHAKTLLPASGFTGLNSAASGFHYQQTFNYSTSPYTVEQGKTDYVWGAQSASTTVPGVYNAFYLPFERDSGTNVTPVGQSLSWWQTNHPDWIEYKCDKTSPAYEYGDSNVPLDITNSAWLDYVMQNYVSWAFAHGYLGIAFDNLHTTNEFGRCGHFDISHNWVAQYTGNKVDTAYSNDVIAWAQNMASRIHTAKSGSTMAINFRYNPSDSTTSVALLGAADISADEGGWTNYGSGNITDSAWLTYTNNLTQYVTLPGKGFLQFCQEPVVWTSVTNAMTQWCMANYFLVKNDISYLGITGSDGYGKFEWRNEYSAAQVGTAASSMSLVPGTGAYTRSFTSGVVYVNPSSTTSYTVNLPAGTFQDLYGVTQGTSVVLAPVTGLVLVQTASPTPTPPPTSTPTPPPTSTPTPAPTSTPVPTFPCVVLQNGLMKVATCSGSYTIP